MMDFEAARNKMVENQIRTTDVTAHSVLEAFWAVPREAFVPEDKVRLAYIDEDLEIAPGRYIMEPSPLAKLMQLAQINKNDVVLEIGCGGGYAAAILSQLAGSVVAVESDESLAAKATSTLSELGYDNVAIVTGPLEAGYAAEAPYDVIFINGAVEFVPDELIGQLREGGKLVAVIGYGNAAYATVFTRAQGSYSKSTFFNAAVRPLPGFRKVEEFVF